MDQATTGQEVMVADDPASIIIHDPPKKSDEGSEVIQEGGVHPSSPPLSRVADDVGCRIVSSAELLKRYQARLGDESSQLWGLRVRSSAVTLLNGETSAGKTVFLHNLAFHLATGAEFLGTSPARPLRVLYVDFESNGEILAEHLSAIGTAPQWDFFDLDDLDERGPSLMKRIEEAVQSRRCDVLIVDPLMEAYPVPDENDNAMASKQMLEFRRIARGTGAGVIAVHNSGRAKNRGKFMGRGATARVDRADISINFTACGQTERLLQVTKSRSMNLNEEIRFSFAGELGYQLEDSSTPPQAVVDELQAQVVALAKSEALQGSPLIERKLFMERLDVGKGTPREQALDRALRKSLTIGSLYRVSKGVYALHLAPAPNGGG